MRNYEAERGMESYKALEGIEDHGEEGVGVMGKWQVTC